MNVSALTALILGQAGNNKSSKAPAPAGPPPPATPTSTGGGGAPAPNYKAEASRLIPFDKQGDIRSRLRKGESIESIFSDVKDLHPDLTPEHVKAFAPAAWGQSAAPAPAPAPVVKPAGKEPVMRLGADQIGEFFKTTVGGSSSASIRQPVIPVSTGGGRSSGNSPNPTVTVKSTAKYGSTGEAAAALLGKINNGEYAAPANFPAGAADDVKIKFLQNLGERAINTAPRPQVRPAAGRIVGTTKADVPMVTGQAPQATQTGHMLPRFVPKVDVKSLTHHLYDSNRSSNLLNVFDSVVQGANAANKPLGDKLMAVHNLAKSGRDYGVWGDLATAYAQNAGNKEAQNLILELTRGTTQIAAANETAQSRGWTIGQTKPIVDGWGQTVTQALDTLNRGSVSDIKQLTSRINRTLAGNSNLSAYVGNITYGDYKKFGFTGVNKEPAPAPITVQTLAPTILQSAGKVVQNKMSGEFAKSGKPGYHEAAVAVGKFIDALVQHPDSPITVALTKQIESALRLNDEGTMTPKRLNDIIQYVSLERSNARKGGVQVSQYIANLVNNLNLPNQLLQGTQMSWSDPNFIPDLDRATALLEDKGNTDWTQVYKNIQGHLNERSLSNIMPKTINAITAKIEPKQAKAQLAEGTLYTPEQGRFDLQLKTLKGIAAKSGVPAGQLRLGIFADPESAEAGRVANLGSGGQRLLEQIRSNNPEFYASLVDRALGTPNKKGIRSMPGLRFSGQITADTPLSTQISNRIWHAVFNPANPSAKTTVGALMSQMGEALPEFKTAISGVGDSAKGVKSVIPAQRQAVQAADVEKPSGARYEFNGTDYANMWKLWQRLNSESSPQVKRAINFQLQRLNDKLISAVGSHYVDSAGTGLQKTKAEGASDTKNLITRLLRTEGDKLAATAGDSAVFQEFRNHIGKVVARGQVGSTDTIVNVLDKISSLDPKLKLSTLTLFNPNATRRAVTNNPLGMSNEEFNRFGKQAEAIILKFGNPGDLSTLTDQTKTLDPGVRFLRKLSDPKTAAATLQRIVELTDKAKEGLHIPGRRPEVKTSKSSPTETAALRQVVRASKARKAELAGDPITGAGNSLQRSLSTNASFIGDKGPAYPAPLPSGGSELVHQPFMGKQTAGEWLSEWQQNAGELKGDQRMAAMWLGRQLANGKTLEQVLAYDPSGTAEQNERHQTAIKGVMSAMAQRAPKIGINPSTLELPSRSGEKGVVKYNAEPTDTPRTGRTPQQKRRASLLGRGLLGFGGAAGLMSQDVRKQ